MKKILEYKVFDILKDPENQKFLDKVKKENPDLYTKFLNLVGNKGLQVAKEKYVEHDPEEVKIRKEKEKKEKALLQKLGRQEYKKQKNQEILDTYKKEIDEIESILLLSELKTLPNIMFNDTIIGNFLDGVKKKYTNIFKKLLKTPKYLFIKLNHNIIIDNVVFYLSPFWVEEKPSILIEISQLYNLKTKELKYSINFSLSSDDYWSPIVKSDRKKEEEFLESRNGFINKLNKNNISKEELYDIIFKKFRTAISDEVYEKWKEEYKLKKDVDKYNL